MPILISGDFTGSEREIFRDSLEKEGLIFDDEVTPDTDLGGIRVALMTSWKRLEPLIPRVPNLELVQSFFAGADRINFSNIPNSIIICTASGAMASSVAEHAIALLLSLGRNLKHHQRMLEGGNFSQLDPPNNEMRGKRVGIIGYGSIGREIGRLSRALGLEVWALNSSGVSDADHTYTLKGLDILLRHSNYVIVSIPLNKHTFNLIDQGRLKAMRDDAILINISRGKVISEKDLYHHLKENPRFRAGLDVWWHYPRGNDKWEQKYPFEMLPNVLMTPHNAAIVTGWKDRTIRFCCKNMVDYLKKENIKNKIKREDYLM